MTYSLHLLQEAGQTYYVSVPPLTLKDLSGATKSLANAGAGIVELNTVRKHIDILKGGGLAQLAYPAQVII
ncbi:GLYCTK [Bugula neritina]|uniref:GLYCTK n=1 Tax=Bugula neritina TaxID=10212 RepID=A0A7J7JWF8_BUGNE|nr:GLYCTK [Bugula neritina]